MRPNSPRSHVNAVIEGVARRARSVSPMLISEISCGIRRPKSIQRFQHACEHVRAQSDDRRRSVRRLQHLTDLAEGETGGKLLGSHQFGLHHEACFFVGAAIARQPFRARQHRGASHQQSDAPVTKIDQISRRLPPAAEVVRSHRRNAGGQPIDPDARQIERRHFLHERLVAILSGRQDQAIDAPASQRGDDRDFSLLNVPSRANHQQIPIILEFVLGGVDEFRVERIGDVGHDAADRVRRARAHRLGRRVQARTPGAPPRP